MNDIDFVITWVDGNDVLWQKEKNKYNLTVSEDNNECRYRDWGLLKYWFRAVEKNAPWVRKIHFVTYGHLPEFLNVKHPKLNIVNHQDYIPTKYLPTFSSHPIELNLHRIKGLSEQFVYFNDDMYVINKCEKKDFFQEGKPCYEGVEALIPIYDSEEVWSHALLNNIAVINKKFDKRVVYKKNWKKFFSPKYGKDNLRNICLMPWSYFQAFKNSHLPMPTLKATMEEVWDEENELLDATSSHKFRDIQDVNPYLFRYWDIAKGNFVPYKQQGKAFHLNNSSLEDVEQGILNSDYKLICVNDAENLYEFDMLKERIISAFEKKLPQKCSFEK